MINWCALIGAHQVHQDRNNSEAWMELNALLRRLKFFQAEYAGSMESEIVFFTYELTEVTGKEEFRRNQFV